MEDKFYSRRNMLFLLNEVTRVGELCEHDYFSEHDTEIFEMIIETAEQIAREQLLPYFSEMDKQPPEFKDGRVKVHPMVRNWMQQAGEGGWISAQFPAELGGQQLPIMIRLATSFIFGAANYSASVYPFLTSGAAGLIASFGNQSLKDTYLPKMFAGEWQGTMGLTEPQAGSSLADIRTSATPTEEGHYLIKGEKIFISAGDHDGVDNIVHLVLAKIDGAPDGVKGISLFVVPRLRPEGNVQEYNDVTTSGTFHKMGYKGAPITHLSFGDNADCRGYLVGEAHKGLFYMFQMMNEARLEVGNSAACIASAAYYNSLAYARERLQGRRLGDKDPAQPMVPLIEHADVKRMLLFQRAIVEGSMGLLLQSAKYADLARAHQGEEKEKYELLLDILTPVAKSYPSEMGILSTSVGLQVLGGYGYCDDFPLEQYFRDMRIHTIHEGTTGIQGLDLLGRKVTMRQGAAFKLFVQEVEQTTSVAHEDQLLAPYAQRLDNAMSRLQTVTGALIARMAEDQEGGLSDATLYLELFGIVAVAWQWLLQGIAAQKGLQNATSDGARTFYQGKLVVSRYFYHYELPKIEGLAQRLLENDDLIVRLGAEHFED